MCFLRSLWQAVRSTMDQTTNNLSFLCCHTQIWLLSVYNLTLNHKAKSSYGFSCPQLYWTQYLSALLNSLTVLIKHWAAVSGTGGPVALQGVHTPVVFPALQQRHAPQTRKETVTRTHGECVLMFEFITGSMGCSSYTFDSLVEFDTDKEEPPDVEEPMQKLKEAIGKAMPEQIACFHENCQAYEQVKTSK